MAQAMQNKKKSHKLEEPKRDDFRGQRTWERNCKAVGVSLDLFFFFWGGVKTPKVRRWLDQVFFMKRRVTACNSFLGLPSHALKGTSGWTGASAPMHRVFQVIASHPRGALALARGMPWSSLLLEEGKTWTNVHLDVGRQAVCILQDTTRDMHRALPRHLPTAGLAGEVIGFDMKTVKPR